MISVAEVVSVIVKNNPFLEEGLAQKLINLSSLARRIHPQVEEKVKKNVKTGAIVAALKRLSTNIRTDQKMENILRNLGEMIVRSNLIEFTFANSESLPVKEEKLFQRFEGKNDIFRSLSQGVFETTIIVSKTIENDLRRIFKDEKLITVIDSLSCLTIRMPLENVEVPGLYYTILKQLAWENINLVEVFSTATELTIFLHSYEIDRAFSVLNSFIRETKKNK